MQICREYAARDARIRLTENAKNLGAARNFNRTFELATGDYFKWAAHDDVCAPEFLAEAWTCSPAALERDTGWTASFSLATGLSETAEWYRTHGWL